MSLLKRIQQGYQEQELRELLRHYLTVFVRPDHDPQELFEWKIYIQQKAFTALTTDTISAPAGRWGHDLLRVWSRLDVLLESVLDQEHEHVVMSYHTRQQLIGTILTTYGGSASARN